MTMDCNHNINKKDTFAVIKHNQTAYKHLHADICLSARITSVILCLVLVANLANKK